MNKLTLLMLLPFPVMANCYVDTGITFIDQFSVVQTKTIETDFGTTTATYEMLMPAQTFAPLLRVGCEYDGLHGQLQRVGDEIDLYSGSVFYRWEF